MTILAIIGAVMLASSGGASDFTPATPSAPRSTAYPSVCMPAPGAGPKEAKVTIAYSVTRKGAVENARVRETTDPCFNDAALASARRWTFEPAQLGGKAIEQGDVETTFEFNSEAEADASLSDFDARPAYRKPPPYPWSCMLNAKRREYVLLTFDVDERGRVSNARVNKSTLDCLDKTALDAVKHWKYLPKMENGRATARPNVETMVVFQLTDEAGYGAADFRVKVAKRLWDVREDLKKGVDPKLCLADLAAIEAEFGEEFKSDELATFLQLRGVARMSDGDNRGALDDFKAASAAGLDGVELNHAVGRTIERLEMMIAAEEQKAAGAPSAPQPNADEASAKPTDE